MKSVQITFHKWNAGDGNTRARYWKPAWHEVIFKGNDRFISKLNEGKYFYWNFSVCVCKILNWRWECFMSIRCSLSLLSSSSFNICLVWRCQRVFIQRTALFNMYLISFMHLLMWTVTVQYFVRNVKNSIYCFHNIIQTSHPMVAHKYFWRQSSASFINSISMLHFHCDNRKILIFITK